MNPKISSLRQRLQKEQAAILLTGPTASGKTRLSLALAQQLDADILCCDSVQLYRDLTIGSAKPTPRERNLCPHRLFDILDLETVFSVSEYVDLARQEATHCWERGRLPLFCGGSVQYLSALAEGIQFLDQARDAKLRARLEERYEREGGEKLLEEVRLFDPQTAERLHPRDRKRIVRALEVYAQSGKSPSELNAASTQRGPERPYYVFALDLPRPLLYERINRRVQLMVEEGLVEEVQSLKQREKQTAQSYPILHSAIGYREWFSSDPEPGLDETLDKIRQNSRRYAKRQLTWLRSKPYVHWISSASTEEELGQLFSQLEGLVSPTKARF